MRCPWHTNMPTGIQEYEWNYESNLNGGGDHPSREGRNTPPPFSQRQPSTARAGAIAGAAAQAVCNLLENGVEIGAHQSCCDDDHDRDECSQQAIFNSRAYFAINAPHAELTVRARSEVDVRDRYQGIDPATSQIG